MLSQLSSYWQNLEQETARLFSSLLYGDLGDTMSLGIGLYLALGVIQAVSSGGVATLRRRSDVVHATVRAAKYVDEYEATRRLKLELSRLEIGFEKLNRSILVVVTCLFTAALFGFVYGTIMHDETPPAIVAFLIFAYYLGLPVVIYLAVSLLISKRCSALTKQVKSVEGRVKKRLLGLV